MMSVDDAWATIREVAHREGQAIADANTSLFFQALAMKLRKRERTTGYAWVTEGEAMYLVRNDLKQPGHTIYRYSVPNEDLSDAAQAQPEWLYDQGETV